jgi:hypothetical protein
MNAPVFQCPIQMQPKLAALAPAVFLAVMVGGGWLLYALGRRGVISQGLSGGLGTVLFFVAVIGVVAVVVGGKGRVEVTPEQVIVRRGLVGAVVMPRQGAEYQLTRWRSWVHFARWLEAGPQLRISSGGRAVTVACLAPELARDLPGSGAALVDLPAAVVAPDDFTALLAALGVPAPAAAPGR